MVHLGGANSLRGYQESSFIVPWYGLSTVEIQYRSGPGSRIYIFNDHAIVDENGDWFASYGIGYIQKTGNTVLELSYGLTVKESIRDGKIHVKFLTYF